MALLLTLPMPEAGAEREVVLYRSHNCTNAKAFRAALGDPDVDLLQLPVGVFGQGMPSGTPFIVESANSCSVCGMAVRLWVQWQQRLVIA